jgi:dihydroxy-acid dehydratase
VAARNLHLHVDEQELEKRNKSLDLSKFAATRGYHKLYMDHVLQADKGVDFDFLI